MNKYLKQLSLFLIGYLVYLVTVYSFNKITLKFSDYNISNINTLVVGDSHSATALETKILDNAINISIFSEPYVVTYLKLKDILNRCIVDTVLLSFSPHNLSAYNDFKFSDFTLSKMYFNESYALFNYNYLKDINANMKGYYTTYFKNMFLLPKLNHLDGLVGKFSKRTITFNLDSAGIKNKINKHYYRNNRMYNISKKSITYLDSIKIICQKNNINLILISTPLHRKYSQSIPYTFLEEFNLQKQKLLNNGLKVYDYSNLYKGDSLFYDGDHLNFKGAKYFTKKIKFLLNNN